MNRFLYLIYLLLFGLPAFAQPQEFDTVLYLPDYRLKTQFLNGEISRAERWDTAPVPSRFSSRFLTDRRLLPQSYAELDWGGYLGSYADTLIWFVSGDPQSLPLSALWAEEYAPYLTAFFKRVNYFYESKVTLSYLGGKTLYNRWTATPASLRQGVNKVVAFLKENDFSGIDLDWEFPANPAEHAKMTQLVRAFKTHPDMRERTVSVVTAQYRKYAQEVYDLVDTVNLMAYDYNHYHSTLENAIQATFDLLASRGVPPEKIVLGMPFYARGFTEGVNDRKAWGTVSYYGKIAKEFSPAADKNLLLKENSGLPYSYFFNGKNLIGEKTRFALANQLGGVMVWEVFQDTVDKSSLLRQIERERKLFYK